MRKSFLHILFFVLPFISSAQSTTVMDTLWWDRMGAGGDESLERMILANDGSLWAIGTTSSSSNYGNDIYLIHLDSSHQCLGSYSYGGNGMEQGADLIQLSNGNLLLLGTTSSFEAVGYDVVLYEVNGAGEIQNMNVIVEDGWQWAQRFAMLSDDEVVISGKSMNAAGKWDFRIWETSLVSLWSNPQFEPTKWDASIGTYDLASSFVASENNNSGAIGFVGFWNQDSIPRTQVFTWNPGQGIIWNENNLIANDSILMFDAIQKNSGLVLAGGFWHNEQFRPQLMRWEESTGLYSITNYPNYQRETMFHGIGYLQDSAKYCAVGWSFEFGFGMGGAFYNFFDQNNQWIGNGFIGGDLLCKMNDVIFDENNKLHSIGFDQSNSQGQSQQAWIVRGNGSLFTQPSTFQVQNQIETCFTVGSAEVEQELFSYQWQDNQLTWLGDAHLIAVTDVLGRGIDFEKIGTNAAMLPMNSQFLMLQWDLNGAKIIRKLFH